MIRFGSATRTLVVPFALALALASCGSQVVRTPVPTATPVATSATPGMLHLTMAPPYDQARLQLAYLAGGVRVEGETVNSGIEVIVNRQFAPGSVQVFYNDLACDGAFQIASNMETDVVLNLDFKACAVSTAATHPVGSIKHPELPTTASVGALLPFGVPSVFVVQSLDTPGAKPVAEVTVDHSPWEAGQVVVQPGRYKVSVLVDGAVLANEVLDLERGEDLVSMLRVLPPGVPRHCGDIAAALCEQAIAAAYAHGLSIDGTTIVAAVSVRPTEVVSCGSSLTPEFDLMFRLANPTGEIWVTVGRAPDGRLLACTY